MLALRNGQFVSVERGAVILGSECNRLVFVNERETSHTGRSNIDAAVRILSSDLNFRTKCGNALEPATAKGSSAIRGTFRLNEFELRRHGATLRPALAN